MWGGEPMSAIVTDPLNHAIEPSKQKARRHYGSHPYFTKRAWNVVQGYIQHFSAPGETVLDPFGGSGVTAVESLVLRRKAIYNDISSWAGFLAQQTAVAPVDLGELREAFAKVEDQCRCFLEEIWKTPNSELGKRTVQDWYPKNIPLPKSADVETVEELFTPRMLHGLSRLRAVIMAIKVKPVRDLLLLAFSATLARINRTFLSTNNRRESRGGSAIFSIYRYKVARKPVELPLWDQFAQRFHRLVEAKKETNQLIGKFYQEGKTAQFQQGSATRLNEWIKPGSIDYIYTDPPYGGHISYLDLSTMWAAWLNFPITAGDRKEEVIEGGGLRKTREDYLGLLAASLQQMHETLKSGHWLSIVFAHRDTALWDSLVCSCRDAGFRYANTVVQPVGVVWSMHKKKNPLRVLSGELVLNFRKGPPLTRAFPLSSTSDAVATVRECCEKEIVSKCGATTEDMHHAVVPSLLEKGQLGDFARKNGDLTPILEKFFDFQGEQGKWHLRLDQKVAAKIPRVDLLKYSVIRLLQESEECGNYAIEANLIGNLLALLGNKILKGELRTVLKEVGVSQDDDRWSLKETGPRKEVVLF
jgi:hypothetical protein